MWMYVPRPWYTWYSVVIICYIVVQFAIFKPLGYCFEEAMEFGVKVSFAGRPVSRLVGWYIESRGMAKKFWEGAIQFHGAVHGLGVAGWVASQGAGYECREEYLRFQPWYEV